MCVYGGNLKINTVCFHVSPCRRVGMARVVKGKTGGKKTRQRASKVASSRLNQQHVSLMQSEWEDFGCNHRFHIPAATRSCQLPPWAPLMTAKRARRCRERPQRRVCVYTYRIFTFFTSCCRRGAVWGWKTGFQAVQQQFFFFLFWRVSLVGGVGGGGGASDVCYVPFLSCFWEH